MPGPVTVPSAQGLFWRNWKLTRYYCFKKVFYAANMCVVVGGACEVLRTHRDTDREAPRKQRGRRSRSRSRERLGSSQAWQRWRVKPPDLGEWGPWGHLWKGVSDSCSERRGLRVLSWTQGPHGPSLTVTCCPGHWVRSSLRPLSGCKF